MLLSQLYPAVAMTYPASIVERGPAMLIGPGSLTARFGVSASCIQDAIEAGRLPAPASHHKGTAMWSIGSIEDHAYEIGTALGVLDIHGIGQRCQMLPEIVEAAHAAGKLPAPIGTCTSGPIWAAADIEARANELKEVLYEMLADRLEGELRKRRTAWAGAE